MSFASPALAVTGDDREAGHPDATVVLADTEALRDGYAAALVDVVAMLLLAVRARSPYGLRSLWGVVADDVAGHCAPPDRRPAAFRAGTRRPGNRCRRP